MPLTRTHAGHHTTPVRTTRATARPSLKQRILGPKRVTPTRRAAGPTTTTTTTTTRTTRTTGGGHGTRAVGTGVHHKRHATMGDKISGAMMKLKGSLTHRPGLKAAGTRRMHGTDGRNARRVY
ncbi:hypothetical protein P154DRAFT_524762 [Amniculicola lignicola CBS 123094]|uniref:Uncharacterized protein n=1 Tax=Amniculicola lignicola CBS 123094 TaxID=1392246 RepID=A0A6A5WIQ6_9PLEO|nr:hypothetical protein P154DRAFT_524762 [Amniculicola lignicola CBS 123094]